MIIVKSNNITVFKESMSVIKKVTEEIFNLEIVEKEEVDEYRVKISIIGKSSHDKKDKSTICIHGDSLEKQRKYLKKLRKDEYHIMDILKEFMIDEKEIGVVTAISFKSNIENDKFINDSWIINEVWIYNVKTGVVEEINNAVYSI